MSAGEPVLVFAPEAAVSNRADAEGVRAYLELVPNKPDAPGEARRAGAARADKPKGDIGAPQVADALLGGRQRRA